MHDNDYDHSKQFCSTILKRNPRYRNFVKKKNICFRDEAGFLINGSVSKRNHFVYGHNNPHAVEEEIKSPSVNYWAMILTRYGLIYRIIHSTVTSEAYKDILESGLPSFSGFEETKTCGSNKIGHPHTIPSSSAIILTNTSVEDGLDLVVQYQSPPRSLHCDRKPRPSTILEQEERMRTTLESISVIYQDLMISSSDAASCVL